MWLEQGNTYLNIAREHVRLMLRTAYDYPKTAKYKHILIALLSMVQVAIVVGNRDQAECYFIEAEKFIRVKGLNRKKSRKVRMLHHCYVFERMFHESIYIAGTNSPQRNHARRAIESSGAVAYSQDSLSFRLGDWSDLDGQMLRVKCREEGENDLHLQNPGLWPKTLYPEIFGVPEKYVFALSLVIRLGQWRDDARHQDAADALSLKDFLSRAKTVERYIKQLYRQSLTTEFPSTHQTEASEHGLDDMLRAMQHALTIYFYRRIYDMEACMLQTHVVGVRDCLLRFEAAGAGMLYGSARLLWPAFIAACEAEDPQVQASFSEWFKTSASRSGLRYFDNARANIEQVWGEQQKSDGSRFTWVEFMRKDFSAAHNTP
jgi:arginine metabolism regulation protein II